MNILGKTTKCKQLVAAVGMLCVLSMISINASATVINTKSASGLTPSGKGWGVQSKVPAPISTNPNIMQNGISYHGGPVLGTTDSTIPNIYYIWYGNWANNTAVKLLANLALGIGKSYNYNINSTYTDALGNPVMRKVGFPKPGIFDNYSLGATLDDNGVYTVVANAINNRKLPLDPNGIYFVLTSADVKETSGFCTNYCGWHSYGNVQNTTIQFAFVGNGERCPNACLAQSVSPNNNAGADGMANVIVHELEEAVTDPQLNAWYDNIGFENADKCAWQFGTTKSAPNGSQYNMTIAYVNYLVQQNWMNLNNGFCANGRVAA